MQWQWQWESDSGLTLLPCCYYYWLRHHHRFQQCLWTFWRGERCNSSVRERARAQCWCQYVEDINIIIICWYWCRWSMMMPMSILSMSMRKYSHMMYDGQADDEWCASSWGNMLIWRMTDRRTMNGVRHQNGYGTAEFRRRLQSEPGACPWCQLSMMRATLN